MSIDIKLAKLRHPFDLTCDKETPLLVTPGDVITDNSGFMRGHGTFTNKESLFASVSGVVERVNKLIYVRPLKSRYTGEVGDVVVGRIIEVQQRRWKVDVNSRLHATLMLSSVNLPGGELRRRSVEDELTMRQYLQEGDLISAEVQLVHSDGTLALHTRSLKYGKLCQGMLLKVNPFLIKRCKTHFHSLACGAELILGNNGYIWLAPASAKGNIVEGGFSQNLEPVSDEDRRILSRLRNCILGLATCRVPLFDTSILYAYEESQKYHIQDLLRDEIYQDIALCTRSRVLAESS